jgi:hypothetical protein
MIIIIILTYAITVIITIITVIDIHISNNYKTTTIIPISITIITIISNI